MVPFVARTFLPVTRNDGTAGCGCKDNKFNQNRIIVKFASFITPIQNIISYRFED
jgi:hypothetical protein